MRSIAESVLYLPLGWLLCGWDLHTIRADGNQLPIFGPILRIFTDVSPTFRRFFQLFADIVCVSCSVSPTQVDSNQSAKYSVWDAEQWRVADDHLHSVLWHLYVYVHRRNPCIALSLGMTVVVCWHSVPLLCIRASFTLSSFREFVWMMNFSLKDICAVDSYGKMTLLANSISHVRRISIEGVLLLVWVVQYPF